MEPEPSQREIINAIGGIVAIFAGLFILLMCSFAQDSIQQTKEKYTNGNHKLQSTTYINEKYKDGNYKSFHTMINHCKGTTRIIGIGEDDDNFHYAKFQFLVIDSTNTVYGCSIGSTMGLNIGDTVKRAHN